MKVPERARRRPSQASGAAPKPRGSHSSRGTPRPSRTAIAARLFGSSSRKNFAAARIASAARVSFARSAREPERRVGSGIPRAAREVGDRLGELELLGLANERDRVALGSAAEAVVETLVGVDVERGGLLAVERAEPLPGVARLLQPGDGTDERDEVGRREDVVLEVVGDLVGGVQQVLQFPNTIRSAFIPLARQLGARRGWASHAPPDPPPRITSSVRQAQRWSPHRHLPARRQVGGSRRRGARQGTPGRRRRGGRSRNRGRSSGSPCPRGGRR